MAVWVVVLEASVDRDVTSDLEADDLDALARALAEHYAVVAGTGRSYETELWVEDNMASGALLTAERVLQAAAREVGLATSEIVRAELRNAKAIEEGVIAFGAAPGAGELAKRAAKKKAGGKKAVAKKAARPGGSTRRRKQTS